MSDYFKTYREIMKMLYDRIHNGSDIITSYNETKDKIILQTKFQTKFEIEKNNYIHIDDALENTRSKIKKQISSYRRAVMQYLSDDDVPESIIRNEAATILQEEQILNQLISAKKEGKLYVKTIYGKDGQVIYDLLLPTKRKKTMDEQNLQLETNIKKDMKITATTKQVPEKKIKQILFETLAECNAHPSKTNKALSKDDLVKIIEESMKRGLYENMPKGYKSKSKKEICRMLFEL
tara:strand:- start:2417 stop:3124 length:708 start_codon:yes stop_codon:yes gene_type:complete